jgi:hypothetical protein
MEQPSPKLAPLAMLIGTWDTTIVPFNPDGSKGQMSKATDVYEWSPNGHFIYHTVDAMMGGERVQSMEVIAAEPSTGTWLTHSYDADGSVNSFTADLRDHTWFLTGDTQRFTGQLDAAGRELSGQWEQRSHSDWPPLMKVTLRKRA